jgi:hypothetical protein
MYTAQPYAAAPGDMYTHAAAAAGFDGWAVAQQQHQAYVTLNRGMGHPTHMLQPHLAAAHGMGHPMLAQPQHHVMPGTHVSMVQQPQNTAAAPGLMMAWAPQHVLPNMRPPTNGINSSHMIGQDISKGTWQVSGNSSGGRGSNGYSSSSARGVRQGSSSSGPGAQQQFGSSGGRGRGRRNIVLNTKPGESRSCLLSSSDHALNALHSHVVCTTSELHKCYCKWVVTCIHSSRWAVWLLALLYVQLLDATACMHIEHTCWQLMLLRSLAGSSRSTAWQIRNSFHADRACSTKVLQSSRHCALRLGFDLVTQHMRHAVTCCYILLQVTFQMLLWRSLHGQCGALLQESHWTGRC